MSEREFETWLSLLSGMLRLNPTQREELSQELRTHLEDRLDDLIASGLSRDEAIASALEEFGDAAGLAHHFSQVAYLSKRRRIMRWTYGTIAASTCAILVLATFWPQNNPVGPLAPPVAVSDEPAAGEGEDAPVAGTLGISGLGTVTPPPDARSQIEAKLNQPLAEVQFVETPLSEVLHYLSSTLEIDILVNRTAMETYGYATDSSVTITLDHGKISTHTLLELILEQLGYNHEIGYTIRDQIVYITEKDSLLETVVYNCRDLFPSAAAGMTSGFGGMTSQLGAAPGMMPGAAMGEMGYEGYPSGDMGIHLIQVVETTIEPASWMRSGGPGSIQIFGGLLIIKNTQSVHRDVEKLLEMLRKANETGPPQQLGQPTSTNYPGEPVSRNGSGFF